MLDRADAIFKLAMSFAALCLGVGIGYYYGLFLPAQATATAERIAAKEEAQKITQRSQENKRSEMAEAAQTTYDVCIADASASYSSRWDSTCRRMRADDEKRRQNCVAQGYGGCDSITVRPASDCSLHSDTADDYDAAHQASKRLCLDEMKAKQLQM